MSSLRQAALLARPCKNSTAFLLCDIQERFRTVLSRPENVIKTAAKMIEASQILKIPLLVTEQNPEKLGKTVAELDVSSAKLVDPKMKFSMYTPNVSRFFNSHPHIKNVVLFGIESHVCIYQTAVDFLRNNYQVFLVADGIDSQHEIEVPLALDQLRSFGAVVTSSDSIIFQILESADHPDFKLISNLVKRHSKL